MCWIMYCIAEICGFEVYAFKICTKCQIQSHYYVHIIANIMLLVTNYFVYWKTVKHLPQMPTFYVSFTESIAPTSVEVLYTRYYNGIRYLPSSSSPAKLSDDQWYTLQQTIHLCFSPQLKNAQPPECKQQ